MRFIRKAETAKRVGWSPSHLMRQVRAGAFPAPVKLGANSIAFVEEEVEAWMRERVQERDKLFRKAA
jgi:prophage regulatory protein